MKTKEKVFANNINTEERNLIGCKALAGESVTVISQEHKINREFVYNQKKRIEKILESKEHNVEASMVILNKKMIEKIIVGCMLICKASTEDTQRFLDWIFMVWVSIGKISNIINEAALKATEWNNSIDLSKIKIGANDEIFQGQSPVLVGVDPQTTFTYLLEAVDNRDSTTWGFHLLEKERHQGLHLENTVNDGGTGLRKGIKDAFPGVETQLDTFHTEYDFSKAVFAAERYAYKKIKEEEKLKKKILKGNKPENLEKYQTAVIQAIESIEIYDNLNILHLWIMELLQIGGYFYDERIELFKFIIQQIESLPKKNAYLEKALKFIKENTSEILQFVKKAETLMDRLSTEENIELEVLKKMWKQLRYSPESAEFNILEAQIGESLGTRYEEIHRKWDEIMANVVRASSMVECINSLIRPYLFLKKAVPSKFLALLQFYFNTRKYRRSRKPERVGKSPIELLTGVTYGNPLEILGY
jgi:tetratricopeptide (TPR) repeat protein